MVIYGNLWESMVKIYGIQLCFRFFLYFFYGNPYQHPTVTRGQWRFAMLSPRGCCASFANPKMPIVHRWSCRPAWCWDIADTQCHQRSMENHHFSWENSLFLWSFSIATLNYQRVSHLLPFYHEILWRHNEATAVDSGWYRWCRYHWPTISFSHVLPH